MLEKAFLALCPLAAPQPYIPLRGTVPMWLLLPARWDVVLGHSLAKVGVSCFPSCEGAEQGHPYDLGDIIRGPWRMEGPGCVQEPGLVVLICLKSEVRRLIGSFTRFSGKVKSLWCPGSRSLPAKPSFTL